MKEYITKLDAAQKSVAVEDTILTKDVLTTAGSQMLYNFVPLFDAEVIARLKAAGFGICGKANVGEFGLDLLGETSHYGKCLDENGSLCLPSASLVKSGLAQYALCADINGAPRRGAALSGLCFVKPTYGTVSRYGLVPCVCSGEQIGVMAKTASEAAELLGAVAGHDDKDGTSLSCGISDYTPDSSVSGMKFAIVSELYDAAGKDMQSEIDAFAQKLEKAGASVEMISVPEILLSLPAWHIALCAETCNNLSRYDGVKFGYRAENYTNIEELYINSRTESMQLLSKSIILYGSDVLSKSRYDELYDKTLRIRRVIRTALDAQLERFDGLLTPTCSKTEYKDGEATLQTVFNEEKFIAPASLTGLPAVVGGGVQLLGAALSEKTLLSAVYCVEKESE